MTKETALNLTKAQKAVVDRMRDGWQLGVYKNNVAEYGRMQCRLQKGGVGKGGATEKVSTATFNLMNALKLFTLVSGDYRVDKYELDSTLFPPAIRAPGEAAANQ